MTRRGCKQSPINRPEFRPHELPAQDLELVAQHQQLDVFHMQSPTATNKCAEQRPHSKVEKRESHAADTPSPRPTELRHEYWRPSRLAVRGRRRERRERLKQAELIRAKRQTGNLRAAPLDA